MPSAKLVLSAEQILNVKRGASVARHESAIIKVHVDFSGRPVAAPHQVIIPSFSTPKFVSDVGSLFAVWWIEELTSDVSIGLITAISGRPDGNHGSANVTFSLRNVSILYEVPSYTDLHDLETKAVDGLRAELESERARYIGRARSEIQTVAAQLPNESYWLKTTQQRMQKRTD